MLQNFFIKLKETGYNYTDDICNELDISPLVAKLLINRGLTDISECERFLNSKIEYLHDPFGLSDLSKAIDRIIEAINKKHNIWIYGDYDVDGVTSTSILILFFESLGVNVKYYIPNRFTEGYGLNNNAIDYIINKGCDLLITVDCGISSIDAINYCNQRNLDVIITDHHNCQSELPNAYAIINPLKPKDKYPFKKLAGVGVSFKLIQGLAKKLNTKIDYNQILPIVAIGTVADVVPLVDENRILVKQGLNLINSSENNGIKALLEITGLRNSKISSGHIGFVIGPRINAAGRLDSALKGVELFICKSLVEAIRLAKELDDENRKRQEIEARILKEAEEIIESNIDLNKQKVLVLSSYNWHHGVIGIVSSRITEKYYRPSVLIAIEDEIGKGSARSIPNFDIFNSMLKVKNLFEKFGGHKQAAGLSILKENIEEFKLEINKIADTILSEEDLKKEIEVEFILDNKDISFTNIEQLKMLEPFGIGNPTPIFIIRDAVITEIKKIGKDREHLKFKVKIDKDYFDCISFNKGYLFDSLNESDIVDLIVSLEINEYRGNKKIQLRVNEIMLNKLCFDSYSDEFYNFYVDRYIDFIEKIELKNINFNNNNKKNKLRYILEKLTNEENILIIINNFYNFIEIYKEISIKGREFTKKTGVSFGFTRNEKINNIVLLGQYKDLLNKYSEIINYDYNIFNNSSSFSDKIIDLTSYNDIKCLYYDLLYIIPTIDELRYTYLTLVKNNNHSIDEYVLIINNRFRNFNKYKFKIALEIFKKALLIEYSIIDNKILGIKFNNIKEKIDIKSVPIYRKSLQILDYYEKMIKAKNNIKEEK